MDLARGVPPRLDDAERRTLLEVAYQSLETGDERGPARQAITSCESLARPGAAFVTLRRRLSGELRGCCGEVSAWQPLAESVASMTLASARRDPRFVPVTADEVGDLSIEITVLGPLEPIRPQDVEVGRHGLVIRRGGRQGLLLPQVARSQGWDREALLEGLCRKAGLSANCWRQPDAELFAFEAVSWGERKRRGVGGLDRDAAGR